MLSQVTKLWREQKMTPLNVLFSQPNNTKPEDNQI